MNKDLTSFGDLLPGETHFVSAAYLRMRSDWFNRLRWLAVVALFVMATLSVTVGQIPLPLAYIYGICVILILLNSGYVLHNRLREPVDLRTETRLVKLQIVVDLVLLTAVLNLTGGIENPFHYVYVIHVVIASLLFKGREVYTIAVLAAILFCGEVVLERLHLLPHNHMPHCTEAAHSFSYTVVALTAFCLIVLFSAYMAAKFMAHNRRIKDDLVERQQQLSDSGKAKLDFFRFVTHEIKSPVITAQSAIEAVLAVGADGLAADARDLLSRAIRRLTQATDIVKDLADFTQGGVLREKEDADVDLRVLVARVLESQSELIAERALKLETDLPQKPLLLRTNEDMFEKIILNLVGNAVRYNRDGGLLHVGLSDYRDRVVFTVKDSGIGIPPEDQQKVFQEFFRSRSAREVSSLGTGLGLSIVKKFVEKLGGDVGLESQPDVGTTFTITMWKS